MTSLVDLERCRAQYFDGAVGDAVEPSSSPSEGSPSPLRSLTENAVAGLVGTPTSISSHSTGRDPVLDKHGGFHHSRKGHRSHTRDSSTSSSKKLSSLLMLTTDRLDKETRRANDAERRLSEVIAQARSSNEARLIAQRDCTRTGEELRLYKLQYDNAQREIFKAQELIDQIEAERQEAEAAAARARSTARKLKEQNLVIMAREEGRLAGYQEGLATGRRMAYEERMRASDYSEESDSGDEVMLPEHPSNIRLRSSTPGTGSRPSSRPPAARQPPPAPPQPMRPPSRGSRATFESALHSSTLATPTQSPQPTQARPPPPPIRVEVTPPPKNRARSKSDPLSYPPDNWIPVADERLHIAIPPPHHMSPSPSFDTLGPPGSAPIPPPPVVAEDAPVETSTTSDTSSETVPRQPVLHPRGYASYALEYRGGNPQRSRNPDPFSPSSTRMSDYGILGSPQADAERIKVPLEAQHFEIERGSTSTPVRDKRIRTWSLRKKTEADLSSPASPAQVPPVTEGTIAAPRPRRPGKSPLSRLSESSSSSSSITVAKPSSSSNSSPERTKLDPRNSGNDSRTPLGWLFRKRMKEGANQRVSGSSNSVGISVESPSESGSMDQDDVPPERPPQPSLLSPGYRPVVMATSTSTPKTAGGNQNLPPLSDFNNLVSPGQGGVAVANLPPGFVPNHSPTQVQQGDGGDGQSHRRPASTGSKRKDFYEAASLTPGVQYPTPPSGADIPRSKSRASRSSRHGQVPGSLATP